MPPQSSYLPLKLRCRSAVSTRGGQRLRSDRAVLCFVPELRGFLQVKSRDAKGGRWRLEKFNSWPLGCT